MRRLYEWEATGTIDGETIAVMLYPEHRNAIERAGYKPTWDMPEIVVSEDMPVLLDEDNGRRRIAEVLTVGTKDDWIMVVQKCKR